MHEVSVDHVNKIDEFDSKQQDRLKELGIYDIVKKISDLPAPSVTMGLDQLIAATKGSKKQLETLYKGFELKASHYCVSYGEAFAHLVNSQFTKMRQDVIIEIKNIVVQFINEVLPKSVVNFDGIDYWLEGSKFHMGDAEYNVKFDLRNNCKFEFGYNLYSYNSCKMLTMFGVMSDEFAKYYDASANKILISEYLLHRDSLNKYAYPVHKQLVTLWQAGVDKIKFIRRTSSSAYQEVIVQIGINEADENFSYARPMLIMVDEIDKITKRKLKLRKQHWSHNDYLLYIAQYLIEHDAFPLG